MDHYIEITLLPDPEFPTTTLMNALFARLHRGLVDHGGRDIGASFPQFDLGKRTLGTRLRLHGSSEGLARLMKTDWTLGMRDHIEVAPTRPIPGETLHRIVRRVQAKSSPERLRRRLMSRKSIGPEAARIAIPDSAAEVLTLPFVEVSSRTSGQRFKLFIEQLPPQDDPTPGPFGTYGLSGNATIPWF